MLEVVCSEKLPAQWQKLSLKTQQEMIAGRRSLDTDYMAWADQGRTWLRRQFEHTDLIFHTGWSSLNKTITLRVFRKTETVAGGHLVNWEELLFEVTEPADEFITPTTLAKIIMVS